MTETGRGRGPAPRRALEDLRVLELGYGITGSFAARLLADLGADTIKVERPGDGDPVRRLEPFAVDARGAERGALFELLDWNKRSLPLDLGDEASRDVLRSLVERADVVFTSFRPGRLEGWGLDQRTLRAWNPLLVVVSISNFGQEGPYAGYEASDLILQATGGLMQISGSSDREPLKLGLRQSLYFSGLNAAYAALAAYYGRLTTGAGAYLDLSLRECVAAQLVMNEPYYAFAGVVQGRRPPVQDPLAGDPIPVADGYVSLQASDFLAAEDYAELFDRDRRLAAPEFATSALRTKHADGLVEILAGHLAGESGRLFFVRAAARGFLAGFVQGARDLLDCPQLEARGVWHSFEDLPGWRFPAVLAALTRTPTEVVRRAPELGEHAAEILAELGRPRAAAPAAGRREPVDEKRGPLDGLRVIDLSTVFAAPYMSALLADLGAEVIKVEAPHRLDQTRSPSWWGMSFDNAPGDDYWNRQTLFQVVNRGKRSLSLDLGAEEGRELLRELVARSDVLLDNFTPRVLRRWGATYDDLAPLNPGLIMLSNTGYGSTGPWSSFKAQGTTLEVTMGTAEYTGYTDGKPSKAGQSYPDFLAAWSGLIAILAALVHRAATGEGQWIDLGMYQLGLSAIPEALLHYQAHGEELPRRGNDDLGALFSGVFPAAGDDRWLAVSVADADRLSALAAVVPGLERLASGRTSTLDEEGRRIVGAALAAWSAERDAAGAAAELQAAGVAAGPVCDARDLLLEPQLRRRGFYEWVDYGPELGLRPLIGRPYRWESETTAVSVGGRAPEFGEANSYVLGELLGLDEARVAELHELGVVTDAPRGVPPAPPRVELELMLASRLVVAVDESYRELVAEGEEVARVSTGAST